MKKIFASIVLAAAALSVSAQDYTMWPADNSTVKEFSQLVITYDSALDEVTAANVNKITMIRIDDYSFAESAVTATTQGNQIIIKPTAPITVKSKYGIQFEAGAYKVNGIPNADTSYNISIDPTYASPFTYTVQPKAPVLDKIEKIVITFPNATEVAENGYGTSLRDQLGVGARLRTSVEGNAYIIEPFEPVTAQGNYVLDVPVNTLKVDGALFGDVISMQYEVVPAEAEIEIIATPAEGTIYSFGKDIKVTFEGATTVAYVPSDAPEAISMKRLSSGEEGDEGETVLGSVMPNALTINGNSISFDLPEGFPFVAGIYEVTIPAAGIKIDGESPEADIVLTYTLKTLVANWQPKAQVVSELPMFKVTFPDATEVTEDVTAGDIIVKDVDADAVIRSHSSLVGNAVEIALVDQSLLVAGHSYQAIIPAGYLSLDGEVYNMALTSSQVLYSPELPEFSVTTVPAEGTTVTSLSSIAATFAAEGEITLTLAAELGTDNVPYLSLGADRVATATAVTAEGLTINMTFNTVSENGEYTLTIPGELYSINGIPGDALFFNFTVVADEDSISEINAANGQKVIFNLKGQKVSPANGGLYIINGKKVIL